MLGRGAPVRRLAESSALLGGLLIALLAVQLASSGGLTAQSVLASAALLAASLVLASVVRQARHTTAAALALALPAVAFSAYAASGSTAAAWLFVCSLFVFAAWLDGLWAAGAPRLPVRAVEMLAAAAVVGFGTTVVGQIEARFADEEFFVFVQALLLTGLASLFLAGIAVILRDARCRRAAPPRRLVAASLGLYVVLLGGLGLVGVRAYQDSFYALDAAPFPGVSRESPFACGEVAPGERQPSGQSVFERMTAAIARSPDAGAAEWGMLALATRERAHLDAFRSALLAEARAGRFTGAAHSVKYGQYEASIRVYYAARVVDAFPDLFTASERAELREWFSRINERALTVEWVDLLYGLAFSRWPEGPYENQEIGGGLLAQLEATGLAPAHLASLNRDYLWRHARGWEQRFRNTDDSLSYQAEWIRNAYMQAQHAGLTADGQSNQRLSFEWLLLQTRPDLAAFNYNPPTWPRPLAAEYYLGAALLDDPRYLWLADRSLAALERSGGVIHPQPRLEEPLSMVGASPTEGTCLLYSGTGLPTQDGPLAPDKIVFRDGWRPDSAYALLNLRFAGWHRYKATNAFVSLYRAGPLVVERAGDWISWLPRGRAAFRDKRVPREYLSGLLVPQSGLAETVRLLTGTASEWAQDPPHYAVVDEMVNLERLDVSRTTIDEWRGWSSTRTTYFFHDGPIVVVDAGVAHERQGGAAVSWHVAGDGRREGPSMWLRTGSSPAQLVLPPEAWATTAVSPILASEADPATELLYRSPVSGRLDLVSTFLVGDSAGAEVSYAEVRAADQSDRIGGHWLRIQHGGETIELLHREREEPVAHGGLSTTGLATVRRSTEGGPAQICTIGPGSVDVPGAAASTRVLTQTGCVELAP